MAPHTYDGSSSFCTHDDLSNNPKTWMNNLKIWTTFSKHPLSPQQQQQQNHAQTIDTKAPHLFV
jgi:hypothetical protein